jgi:hypothetical protein
MSSGTEQRMLTAMMFTDTYDYLPHLRHSKL